MLVKTFGSQTSTEPINVFLHGFPGFRSKQNQDHAAGVSEQLKMRSDVLLYSGLGVAPGVFSFAECVEQVRAHIKSLCTLHGGKQKINFIGHSWGGFLSLLFAKEFSQHVDRIILISPLLAFKDAKEKRVSFGQVKADYPNMTMGDAEVLANEFVSIGERYPTEKLIAELPDQAKVLFLQARADEITVTPIARERLKYFKTPPKYLELETDHSFLVGREEQFSLIVEHLKGSN